MSSGLRSDPLANEQANVWGSTDSCAIPPMLKEFSCITGPTCHQLPW